MSGPRRVGILARRTEGSLEAGFTLAELAVSLVIISVLFLMTVPIVNTLVRTQASASNTYANTNQLLPVATGIQRLIRSAVSPGPLVTGVPQPAFGDGINTPGLSSANIQCLNSTSSPCLHNGLNLGLSNPANGMAPAPSATAMWFYANSGQQPVGNTQWCKGSGGNNCLGPELVSISCQPNAGGTACASGGTLAVTITLPDATSCPGVTASTGSAYYPTHNWCSYVNNPPQIMYQVHNVWNGNNSATLFQYMLSVPSTSSPDTINPFPAATTNIPNFISSTSDNCVGTTSPAQGGYMTYGCSPGCASATTANPLNPSSCGQSLLGLGMFNVCTAGPGYSSSTTSPEPDANCPSAEVEAVQYDIQVSQGSSNTSGKQTEESTIVYMISPQSTTYAAQVG